MLFENLKDFSQSLINNKRLMCLDIGQKKIGIAISDITRIIANPYKLLIRDGLRKDLNQIEIFAKKEEICGFVMGFPKLMDGEEGEACANIRKLSEFLLEKFNLPIYLQDERLSTRAAFYVLNQTNLTRKKKEKLDDKIAATYILQNTLDMLKYNKFPE